jgi:soluble lytic murein transglycosylase-like protein
MRRWSRRSTAVAVASLVLAVAIVAAVWFALRARPHRHRDITSRAVPRSAPPDLAKYRGEMLSGFDALQRGDSQDAVHHLASFSWGQRAVEEYRLYYLANAYQLGAQPEPARRVLAELWARTPRMIYRDDVGFHLTALYDQRGCAREAAEVFSALASRTASDAVGAAARAGYIEQKLATGDIGAIVLATRNLVAQNPKSAQAGPAIELLRSLSGLPPGAPLPLGAEERVTRVESLVSEGDPTAALGEIAALPDYGSPLKERVQLVKGLALQQQRRFLESETALQPLFGSFFKYAVPALRASVRNNGALASSINPVQFKTIVIRQQVGQTKVRKGKKVIVKPRFRNVKKQVQVINAQLKAKRDGFDRASVERLKDLIRLPIDPALRKQALLSLIDLASAKNQDAYLRDLVAELVKLDPPTEVQLQRFWDKGWAAYEAGDLATATDHFSFIEKTYSLPNVRRQVRYWTARVLERKGEKAGAQAIYDELANAPYEDLYAVFSERRGGHRTVAPTYNPLVQTQDDWPRIVDREMPTELKLAYELNAIGLTRDAQMELRQNRSDMNGRFASSIIGEIDAEMGVSIAASRALRMAFPKLATVEQDSVPSHFIGIDFPLKWADRIKAESQKRGVDPYLVMGLIRQESMYTPDIRSSAGARGLMQLMPPTGRELSQRIGKRYTDAVLSDPGRNIELGVLYVRQLLDQTGGSVELTLASYNAGMGNVRSWRRASHKPIDEFVEDIPFQETRNYVKRVTFYRSAYQRFSQP